MKNLTRALSISCILGTILLCALIKPASAIPPPPPVEIEFTADNLSPNPGDEITLNVKVTASEDLHGEVACVLPEGVQPIVQGAIIHPEIDEYWDPAEYEERSIGALELFLGQLQAGTTEEFTLRVKIYDTERHEFMIRVLAGPQWGVQTKNIVIGMGGQ